MKLLRWIHERNLFLVFLLLTPGAIAYFDSFYVAVALFIIMLTWGIAERVIKNKNSKP